MFFFEILDLMYNVSESQCAWPSYEINNRSDVVPPKKKIRFDV